MGNLCFAVMMSDGSEVAKWIRDPPTRPLPDCVMGQPCDVSSLVDANGEGKLHAIFTIIKNKAGHTATEVACGWAGAVIKLTNQAVVQEQ